MTDPLSANPSPTNPLAAPLRTEAIPHRPEADSFDFRKAGQALKLAVMGHKRLILGITGLTLLLVTLYIAIWPPIYTASVTLSTGSEDDRPREGFYDNWAIFRRNALKDEVVLLTSGPVLKQVIEEMNLGYGDVYHPPLRYITYLWTQSWPGQAWRGTKAFLFPQRSTPYVLTPREIDKARTLDDFRTGVSIQPINDTNIGVLSVQGPSPRVADIANKVAETYIAQRRQRFANEARQAYASLEVETEHARGELRALEQQMERYYTQNDMLLMFEKDKVEISQYLGLQGDLDTRRTTIAQTQRELMSVTGQLARESREVVAGRVVQDNPIFATMKQDLAKLTLTRDNMLIRYRPDSPEVRELNDQIAVLQKQIGGQSARSVEQTSIARNSGYESLRAQKSTLESKLAGDQAALASLSAEVAARRQEVDRIPQKMKESHDLGREHDALEKRYVALQEKLMTAAVTAATAQSAPSSIQIVEPASVPEKASWPSSKLLLIGGLIMGLGAGVVSALLLDYVRDRANRFRLTAPGAPFPLLATVQQDPAFARRLFQR